MKWLANGLIRLLIALILSALVAGTVYLIVEQFPPQTMERRAVAAKIERSEHDPLGLAADLAREVGGSSEDGAVGLTRALTDWLRQNPEPPPLPSPWSPRELLGYVLTSYFVCLAAMAISGLLGFFIFQYLVLPAEPRSKTGWLLAFLGLSGLPAAILMLLFSPFAEAMRTDWVRWVLAEAFEGPVAGLLEYWRAELLVLACLVLGDGLAGMMLLKARALATGARLDSRIATEWAGPRLKGFLLPLPGTLAAVAGREMTERAMSAWWGLLGRFLLTEISLEFMVGILTDLPARGAGTYLFDCLSEGAAPAAFAATAGALMFPLALWRPSLSGHSLRINDPSETWRDRLDRRLQADSERLRALGPYLNPLKLFYNLRRTIAWCGHWLRDYLKALEVFRAYMNLRRLRPTLKETHRWWGNWYLNGLRLFYLLGLLGFISLTSSAFGLWDVELLTGAGWFIALCTTASLLVLLFGLEISIFLARWWKGLLDILLPIFRFPIIFWVLLLLPALPLDRQELRMGSYWLLVLFLVTVWSIVEIAREVAVQHDSDFVRSLRNLGVSEGTIYRRHILVGSCREFIMAHIFDLWMLLLIAEVAMGFGVRFAERAYSFPDLVPYKESFGFQLAVIFDGLHDNQVTAGAVLLPALLLSTLFLSYWLIQIGILSVKQAGGLEYLEAGNKSRTKK